MLSQGNNILDLLLGVRPQSGQTSQAVGNEAGASGQSFPDIFDLLFAGDKPQAMSGTNTDAGSLLDFAGLLSRSAEETVLSQQLTDKTPLSTTGKAAQISHQDFPLLFGLGDISEFGLLQANGTAVADDANPLDTEITEKQQIADAAKMLQLHGMIAGQNIRDLLNEKPVELETGNYRIIDVRVTNKQVILNVEPENDPGNRIRVALPLEQVAESMNSTAAGQSATTLEAATQIPRVKLNDTEKADAAKIDRLLSRMNLKELQISKAGGTESSMPEQQKISADEVVNIKITATRSGEETALRMNLKAADLHATKGRDSTQTSASTAAVPSADDEVVQSNQTRKEFSRTDTSHDETLEQKTEFGTSPKASRIDKLSDAGNLGTGRPDQAHLSSFFDRVSGTRTVLDQQTTPPPVRFTLPDNITAALKTNTRSVMISIEPDNLGPAKLHLAMHNDALTARLTVDSIHAKAAVESSLDQLTDQLARAGVKVHHVEVSVSGGDVGSNMFERRPLWNTKARSNTQSIDRLFDLKTTSTTPAMIPRAEGYVRADGVDVFA